MKRILDFLKTTVIGGLIFLGPVVVLVILIGKALKFAIAIVEPLDEWIPIHSVAGIALVNVFAIVAIVAVCFVAGLLAKTSLASRFVVEAETRILWKLPGYALIKGLSESFASDGNDVSLRPVIARMDDAAEIGFEIERASGVVVVYVPGAPNPWSGSILLMDEERVEPLDAKMVDVIGCLRALGRGSTQLLAAG